ncbi:MAG TPA: AAA family ATPase [Candidatus Eisenbacteria bacterium]|nr:AAA family ATPase [Candidatus Eisenbacteria bacterium]
MDTRNTSAREGSQRELVEAMAAPGFYPNAPSEVIHKETHISHVFLAGDLAYKVKKAVRFSFLDYSSLDKRLHFLSEELRLNRRLAPSVYRGIAPITLERSGYRLNGSGAPVEYALVMRRLPESRLLSALIESGELDSEMMRSLAVVLARFHAGAEKADEVDPATYPDTVASQWRENTDDLRSLALPPRDRESLGIFESFGREFIERYRALFRRRAAEGWIRDVHGDLHCEHVCFAPEGIQIYDCIEFSPKLRRCDLASEIGFLLMDVDVRGAGGFAPDFLDAYLDRMKDSDLPKLLPFYQCYRALVRAKVEAMRAPAADAGRSRYFGAAVRFMWNSFKPFVVLVGGLTGSGKSTLARALGERMGVPVINSDAVRKSIAGGAGETIVPFEAGIYSREMTEATYAAMLEKAEKELGAGNGVILDATFGRRVDRERVRGLAKRYSAPLTIIHCLASERSTKARLARRGAEGRDISDGRWEIYVRQKEIFEPLTEDDARACLELNTEAAPEALARAAEAFIMDRVRRSG